MKIFKWIIATLIIIFALYALLRFVFCGPNYFDVKVMKPMAEAISHYISKNGIPDSLEDIPNLPYKLSGCERKEYYENYDSYAHVDKKDATMHQIEEECYFENVKLKFGITEKLDSSEIGGEIRMISNHETVLIMGVSTSDGKHFTFDEIDIGSSKTSGICNPMRQ